MYNVITCCSSQSLRDDPNLYDTSNVSETYGIVHGKGNDNSILWLSVLKNEKLASLSENVWHLGVDNVLTSNGYLLVVSSFTQSTP